MRRTMCKSKIHRATLTGADLHYEGSLTLDRALMDAADLLEFERIQVVNVNTGARLETYVIAGDRGIVQLNGAAARLGMAGDVVIIIAYGDYDAHELTNYSPRIIHVDATNRPYRGQKMSETRFPTRPPRRNKAD